MDGMRYWKTDRDKFYVEHPYCAPYRTREQAEAWAAKIRAVHNDVFRVVPIEGGWGVEQDLPRA